MMDRGEKRILFTTLVGVNIGLLILAFEVRGWLPVWIALTIDFLIAMYAILWFVSGKLFK